MTVSYILNGTTLTFNRETGALYSVAHPEAGTLIEGGKGILDIAWPYHTDYDTLRVNATAQYRGEAPQIIAEEGKVTVKYSKMARTIDTGAVDELEGGIAAEVIFAECEDGKSISLRCHIKNNSKTIIRQVLFPDMSGIVSRTDDRSDKITFLAGVCEPFRELRSTPETRENFFAWTESCAGRFYHAGGLQEAPMTGRWYDFGTRFGGFGMYRKHWGWGPESLEDMGYNEKLWVKLDNIEDKLRLAFVKDIKIESDGEYDSGEYILTCHGGTWLNGIAPYKAYIAENVKRVVPVPQRAKEMLGFRTIFMNDGYPKDPTDYSWKYSDMPMIGEDMAEHGLYDMNLWYCYSLALPFGKDKFYEEWGGEEEFKKSVQKLKEMGIVATPLVSWISLWDDSCKHYGIEKRTGSWAETPKSVPMFAAPYCNKWACFQISDHSLQQWREDVLAGLRYLRDEVGCPNICWDQYVLGKNCDNFVHDVINEFRLETEEMYPGTLFSSESTLYFESELDNTDFTWNWQYWNGKKAKDLRPYMHAVTTCRPNMNVDSDPVKVKYIFMDNLMLNAYPTRPESYNGSALISEYPEFSKAIKTVAELRKAYLDYFVDSTMISDCAVTVEPECRTTGYVKDGKMLLIVYKDKDEDCTLPLDLTPFLAGEKFNVRICDEDMNETANYAIGAKDNLTVSGKGSQLYMVEISAR